jgi:uncharacterized protein YkwD
MAYTTGEWWGILCIITGVQRIYSLPKKSTIRVVFRKIFRARCLKSRCICPPYGQLSFSLRLTLLVLRKLTRTELYGGKYMLNRTSGYFLLLTLLPGLFFGLLSGTDANASSKTSQAPTSNAQSQRIAYRATDQIRRMALDLVNQDRSQQGIKPLIEDRLLSSAAELHALDMARRGYFDHYSPNGQGPSERFVALGGSPIGIAENIAYAFPKSDRQVNVQVLSDFQQRWMRSAPHRKNLLNARYTHFGYGIAVSPDGDRIYAVQVFGKY